MWGFLIYKKQNHVLRHIDHKLEILMAAIDDLTTQVQANTTVIESALTLIQGLADALKAAGTDPVKLKALQDQLTAEDDKLAAAVAANTGITAAQAGTVSAPTPTTGSNP